MHHLIDTKMMHPLPSQKGTNSKDRIAKVVKAGGLCRRSWVRIPLQMVPCFFNQDARENIKPALHPIRCGDEAAGQRLAWGLRYVRHLMKGTDSNSLATSTTANRIMWVQIPEVPCFTNFITKE